MSPRRVFPTRTTTRPQPEKSRSKYRLRKQPGGKRLNRRSVFRRLSRGSTPPAGANLGNFGKKRVRQLLKHAWEIYHPKKTGADKDGEGYPPDKRPVGEYFCKRTANENDEAKKGHAANVDQKRRVRGGKENRVFPPTKAGAGPTGGGCRRGLSFPTKKKKVRKGIEKKGWSDKVGVARNMLGTEFPKLMRRRTQETINPGFAEKKKKSAAFYPGVRPQQPAITRGQKVTLNDLRSGNRNRPTIGGRGNGGEKPKPPLLADTVCPRYSTRRARKPRPRKRTSPKP